MRALARKPMTAEEFLYAYDGVEGRWELVDGVPVMMSGGTRRHAQVAGNIFAALRVKLRSSSCQPFGSDMGVHIHIHQVRYPDVSVLCDPRDAADELRQAHYPRIIFEVFSPSTADRDRGMKLIEYKSVPSVQMVIHVDPETETSAAYHRLGARDWREYTVERGDDLVLSPVDVTLSAADIFDRD